MPAFKLADVFVPITGDNSLLRKTLDGTKRLLQGFVSNVAQGIGQGIGQAVFGSINGAIVRGMGLIKSSLKSSSDLAESLSKTTVAFGSSAKTILDWSKTSATALGQSRQQALEAASSFGLLFSSMGIAEDESARLSIRLVELATDMASINNIPIEEALIKLRAGLVGETEPLRTVGVLLNAAAVEQEALNSGMANSVKAITEQDKVMARYNLILKQTTKTQGDFARTSDGIANQERILEANRADALARLGSAFSPIYLTILTSINTLIAKISPYGENIVRQLATGMVKGIIYILPAVSAIRDVITYWFKPGSPPRILPDLVRWGASAMNEYLGGWSKADFSILEALGGTLESIIRSFASSGAIAEGDIVSAVFGTRSAIATAVNQWRTAGRVTEDSIQAIQAAAGSAGLSIAGLVRSYFDLEGASRRSAAAQRELADATQRYDDLLDPLNKQLDEINDKQQAIRDKQAISENKKVIRDPRSTANEKRLAQLEIEEIGVRQQIDTVSEERDIALDASEKKLKSAQREEQVARAIYDVQAALLDQTVATNRLITEQNDLRKKQGEEAERLYQAALQYSLAIADNEGKLALLRLELARHTKGSVEYYGILTQIAGLEEQLEGSADDSLIPADSVLPSLDELGIPTWATDLGNLLKRELNKALGIEAAVQPALMGPKTEGFASMLSFGQEGLPERTISDEVKDFVNALKDLTGALAGVTPTLQSFIDLFGGASQEEKDAGEEITTDSESWLQKLTGSFKLWTALINKDWATFWELTKLEMTKQHEQTEEDTGIHWAEIRALYEDEEEGVLKTMQLWIIDMLAAVDGFRIPSVSSWGATLSAWSLALGGWLTDSALNIETFLGNIQTTIAEWDLAGAARSWLGSLWTGMKDYWTTTIMPWWDSTALGQMVDKLPGSEPKDPSSPLAGLQDRGRAIVENLQLGINSASLDIAPASPALLAAGAAATAGGGRSISIAEGAVQISGIAGAGEIVPSMEEAFRQFLENLANA